MNAGQIVNLLLELNVINTQEIDQQLAKIAARIANPDAKQWFMRVPRFFLINMEKLADSPYELPKRFLRTKAYAFDKPGQHAEAPMTNLHGPAIQQDIDTTFDEYNPSKPPKKDMFGKPPAKPADWMTGAKNRKEKLYHFPRFGRRGEVIQRMNSLADWLNFVPPDSKLFNVLRQMKTDDINGFRQVLNDALEWSDDVNDTPQMFVKRKGYRYGNLKMILVNDAETAMELGKNTAWCTKGEYNANDYLRQGNLFVVLKDDKPYVQVHRESGQAKWWKDDHAITQTVAAEIAPLFKYIDLHSAIQSQHDHRDQGVYSLYQAVKALPPDVEPEKLEDLSAPPQKRIVKKRLPPWDDDPPLDTGYRPGAWESILASKSKQLILLRS